MAEISNPLQEGRKEEVKEGREGESEGGREDSGI
jgi:hypothetical protein